MSDPLVPPCCPNDCLSPASTHRQGKKAALLFGRNTLASFLAFGLDVGLLWLLVEQAGLPRIGAAALAFLVAMTFHYALSRLWVFRGTERGLAAGYLYFLVNAGIGLAVTLATFAALIELAGLHYLVARAVASVIAGILVFGLNAVFNFRALGPMSRPVAEEA